MQLDGKRVVIIGGSLGIVQETARLLLADGGLPEEQRVPHRRRAADR
jgi:hypothetical protein